MITGLTKKQKTTLISFDEDGDLIRVQTHNADLKKRLAKYAAQFPEYCRKTDDNGLGGLTYEIQNAHFSPLCSNPVDLLITVFNLYLFDGSLCKQINNFVP